MGIVSINERSEGQSARRTRDESSYRRAWIVKVETASDHLAISELAAPVNIGDPFPQNPSAICEEIESDFIDPADRLHHIVTATYKTPSSDSDGGGSGGGGGSQFEDRPVIRWSHRTVRVPVTVGTLEGEDEERAITNSVGQRFDPPPEDDDVVLVFSYQRNVATYDENRAKLYRGAINSDAFVLGGVPLDKYQARISALDAVTAERNGIRYWQETVEVEIVADWRLRLVDEGTLIVDLNLGGGPVWSSSFDIEKLRWATDGQGEPTRVPILLDGEGNAAAGGAFAELVWSTKLKPERPFALLGLPTTNQP